LARERLGDQFGHGLTVRGWPVRISSYSLPARLIVSLPIAPPSVRPVGAAKMRVGSDRPALVGSEHPALPLGRLAVERVQPSARDLDFQ